MARKTSEQPCKHKFKGENFFTKSTPYYYLYNHLIVINKIYLNLTSTYKNPSILVNSHLETIYPALFRKVNGINPVRERIDTPDDDFLDLDWSMVGSKYLVIICHGLEGSSEKPYMLGMMKAANTLMHSDALAWNYRGCSGEMNLTNRFYHSGATDDLELVVNHAIAKGYQSIFIIGFSLGGNVVLKYLGEMGDSNPFIKASVTFSVPLDLKGCSQKMMDWSNFGYSQRFLKTLKSKFKSKYPPLPKPVTPEMVDKLKHVFHFDDMVTAPLHGFKDANDYYQRCSSLYFLDKIRIPALVVNAQNDPFLSETCYPDMGKNDYVYFEVPEKGGHCGFSDFNNIFYWSEQRAMDFLQGHTSN